MVITCRPGYPCNQVAITSVIFYSVRNNSIPGTRWFTLPLYRCHVHPATEAGPTPGSKPFVLVICRCRYQFDLECSKSRLLAGSAG